MESGTGRLLAKSTVSWMKINHRELEDMVNKGIKRKQKKANNVDLLQKIKMNYNGQRRFKMLTVLPTESRKKKRHQEASHLRLN